MLCYCGNSASMIYVFLSILLVLENCNFRSLRSPWILSFQFAMNPGITGYFTATQLIVCLSVCLCDRRRRWRWTTLCTWSRRARGTLYRVRCRHSGRRRTTNSTRHVTNCHILHMCHQVSHTPHESLLHRPSVRLRSHWYEYYYGFVCKG